MLRQDVIPLPPLEPHPGNVAYMDTETTGLSGGSGTYVFAAAIARPIDCGLRVAQVFLPQPGMEAAFLHALREELEPADTIATFNGASFDLPVLRTRWVMARMPGELSHATHVDLLTLVRSLYRHRLESCSLRMVEERVLGYERDDPIPSAQVPDAYFDYLRAGSRDFLEAALEHNRLDVISLVHLHSRLLLRLNGGETGMDAADWLALGRHRFRRGARADGWRALRNATAFAKGDASATAGLLISKRLVRRGSIAAADSLLGWLEASVTEDIRLSIARARLLEWRRRDASEALSVVEAALRRMPDQVPTSSTAARDSGESWPQAVAGARSATAGKSSSRPFSLTARPSAPTTSGSNSEPEPRTTWANASSWVRRWQSRPAVCASNLSATDRMRAMSGMLSPVRPSALPPASQRSW